MKESEVNCTVHDDKNVKGFFGDYRWLSNFYECPVYFDGLLYASSENAYQAAKCINPENRTRFLNITPSESKKLGRSIQFRKDWLDIRYDIMCVTVFDKFYRNQELRRLLLDTGSKYLEETNYWGDTYYGVCKGKGQNVLGQILMRVRSFWQTNTGNSNNNITRLF